jgi:hypothetical protein
VVSVEVSGGLGGMNSCFTCCFGGLGRTLCQVFLFAVGEKFACAGALCEENLES